MMCPICKINRLTKHERQVTKLCTDCYWENSMREGHIKKGELEFYRSQRKQEIREHKSLVVGLSLFPIGFVLSIIILLILDSFGW
jgi:hypothetical protein